MKVFFSMRDLKMTVDINKKLGYWDAIEAGIKKDNKTGGKP